MSLPERSRPCGGGLAGGLPGPPRIEGTTGRAAVRAVADLTFPSGFRKLSVNSLLDALNSEVLIAYFGPAGLYRSADVKPILPHPRLNQFEGIFYAFVIHGTSNPSLSR